jgi:putative transcriptional regulator
MRSTAALLLVVWSVVCAPAAPDTPPGAERRPARGRLLIASRDLLDPNFARSVVLLVEYDDAGAMGVLVNRPTARSLQDLAPEVETKRTDTIYLGGPVLLSSLLVLMQAKEEPRDAMRVFADVHVLTSRKAVDRALSTELPQRRLRFYAGHAGWGPGQLDAELRVGGWHVMNATADLVFGDAPDRLWERLIARTDGEWTRRWTPSVPFAFAVGVRPAPGRVADRLGPGLVTIGRR